MDSNVIPVNKEKVQELVLFLSESMLELPEYNLNKSRAEQEIIELDNLSQAENMSVEERDRHNSILQGLEVPNNLLL